ncbi:glycosyltransferase family 4 protein [Acidithiobacillus thiooxidans]|uniref:glycosyltransferase family 4 protein n=1 Tax=Acidithiobacillus thiooxidans TaxID=930 RepID=UPI002430812C|nr:glycosyltransferase family 4 protein [Acidithiobacillus thiooxidans]
MKILFINNFYSPDIIGGAEIILKMLAEGARSKGIDVAVLATTDIPGLHQDEVNGVRVWRAGLRNIYWHKYSERPGMLRRRVWHLADLYNPLMIGLVKQVISIEQPTVASVHNLAGFSVSTWSALTEAGVPIFQVLHDHYLLCPAATMYKSGNNCTTQCATCGLMRLPHKLLSRNVAGVIGVSNYILNRHIEAGFFHGVDNRNVIYNTRTEQDIGLLITHDDSSKGNRPLRFGFIGALTSVKGIEMLLNVYVNHPFPNTELIVAGTGDINYVRKLESMAAGHPVCFLGRVNPAEFYSSVDVVIVPSLWNEPLATVIIEAMICGKVIIASNTGGSSELIFDKQNGLLFEPDDPNALHDAITRVSDDLSLRSRLVDGAISIRRDFMDRDRFLDAHISCYRGAEDVG